MNYSEHPDHVRVDFFTERNKWYTTEEVVWTGPYESVFTSKSVTLIHDSFRISLRNHFGDKPRLVGMWAVCLEPYHRYSHPLMVKWEG
jgi:hypothetical protein